MTARMRLISMGVAAALGAGVAGAALGAASATTAAPAGPQAVQAVGQEQLSSAVRAFIAAVKKVPGLFSKLVSAIGRGYTAFEAWYNGLPWYLRAPLALFNLYTVFLEIKKQLGL